jgi:hypothetical protein
VGGLFGTAPATSQKPSGFLRTTRETRHRCEMRISAAGLLAPLRPQRSHDITITYLLLFAVDLTVSMRDSYRQPGKY